MSGERINYGEFKIAKEFLPLIKLRLKKILGKKSKKNGGVLIVDTCIIGDFLATLPALSQFIKINDLNVDMIVSPSTKSIAEKIRGVNKVFTAKSVYNRGIEKTSKIANIPNKYGLIVVLRISQDAYNMIKDIEFFDLITYDATYLKFFFHLVKNILMKNKIKQARKINFEIFGLKEPPNKIKFEEIFSFKKSDYNKVAKILRSIGDGKKIIIHTGSGWKAKLWDNKKWVSLLKKIHNLGRFKFVFVGANIDEEKSFKDIKKNLNFKIYSLIDKMDLKDLLLLMRKSNYFIGIDSGPRNMAHLSDLRSISLLGPGIKDFMPQDQKDIVIDKSNPRATSLFYYAQSGMEKISVEEVFHAFNKLLRIN